MRRVLVGLDRMCEDLFKCLRLLCEEERESARERERRDVIYKKGCEGENVGVDIRILYLHLGILDLDS